MSCCGFDGDEMDRKVLLASFDKAVEMHRSCPLNGAASSSWEPKETWAMTGL